ncbi:MAG: hypothetical protein WAN44_01235 [Propionibacteriaceae bacterium]
MSQPALHTLSRTASVVGGLLCKDADAMPVDQRRGTRVSVDAATTVLLAERDPYAAEFAEYFLRTDGYAVRIVLDPAAAAEILRDEPPVIGRTSLRVKTDASEPDIDDEDHRQERCSRMPRNKKPKRRAAPSPSSVVVSQHGHDLSSSWR